MDQWLEVAKVYGPLGFITLALGWFIYKKVWPRVEKQLDNAEKERADFAKRLEEQGQRFTDALKAQREADERRFEAQGQRFTEAMRTQNVFAAEIHKESMKATGEITHELRTLNTRLNSNGK